MGEGGAGSLWPKKGPRSVPRGRAGMFIPPPRLRALLGPFSGQRLPNVRRLQIYIIPPILFEHLVVFEKDRSKSLAYTAPVSRQYVSVDFFRAGDIEKFHLVAFAIDLETDLVAIIDTPKNVLEQSLARNLGLILTKGSNVLFTLQVATNVPTKGGSGLDGFRLLLLVGHWGTLLSTLSLFWFVQVRTLVTNGDLPLELPS